MDRLLSNPGFLLTVGGLLTGALVVALARLELTVTGWRIHWRTRQHLKRGGRLYCLHGGCREQHTDLDEDFCAEHRAGP